MNADSSPHRFATEADWAALRSAWTLPEEVTYLNHGSFGPSPQAVIDARLEWTRRLERQPMDFFLRLLPPALDEARSRLGALVGTAGDRLVFVDNATVAMNIVAASVDLQPDDEVLLSDHEYGAVVRIWERACRRRGARLVVQPLPAYLVSADEVADALLSGAGPRTRLLVVSHVTSPTAVVLPAAEICRRAKERGLEVCLDGPHALAMLELDLAALDCDYYTASGHKWLCGPFGSGFLYVHPRVQTRLEPVVLSWPNGPGEDPNWRSEFTWPGTRDPAAWLALPAAIDFLDGVGWSAFRRRTHELARQARRLLERRVGARALVPDSPQWYGSMVALELPPGDAPALQRLLWDRHRIEVPVIAWQHRRFIRPSCHLYNGPNDLERLADAMEEAISRVPGETP